MKLLGPSSSLIPESLFYKKGEGNTQRRIPEIAVEGGQELDEAENFSRDTTESLCAGTPGTCGDNDWQK